MLTHISFDFLHELKDGCRLFVYFVNFNLDILSCYGNWVNSYSGAVKINRYLGSERVQNIGLCSAVFIVVSHIVFARAPTYPTKIFTRQSKEYYIRKMPEIFSYNMIVTEYFVTGVLKGVSAPLQSGRYHPLIPR